MGSCRAPALNCFRAIVFFSGELHRSPPQGQERFIKIADPSVCPTWGLFLVPFKIPCFSPIVKNFWGTSSFFLFRGAQIFFLVLVSNNRVCLFLYFQWELRSMANVCLLSIILSVFLFTEGRLFTVCPSAVLRTAVSNAFFLKGCLVISNRPSGGSSGPSVCPTGGGGAKGYLFFDSKKLTINKSLSNLYLYFTIN